MGEKNNPMGKKVLKSEFKEKKVTKQRGENSIVGSWREKPDRKRVAVKARKKKIEKKTKMKTTWKLRWKGVPERRSGQL